MRDHGRWDEAAAAYQRHLAAYPEDFAIWIQLGHVEKESGDFVSADQAYAKALAIDPEDADLLLNYGHLSRLRGDLKAAAVAYRRSFAQDGNDSALRELSDPSLRPYLAGIEGGARYLPAEAGAMAAVVVETGLFNADWYRTRYPDLANHANLLDHFAQLGMHEGRDPGPDFSSGLYAIFYADHLQPGESAFAHYLDKGRKLGLRPVAANSYPVWLDQFDMLDDEDRTGIVRHARDAGFRSVTICQVLDPDGCAYAENIVASWRNQLLADWQAHVVFTDDVTAEDRAAVAALVGNDARIVLAGDGRLPTPDKARDLLLAYGAVRLASHATYLVQAALVGEDALVAYGDHDEWHRTERVSPRFKPVFSPTLLDSDFYLGRVLAFRAGALGDGEIAAMVDGLQSWTVDPAADYLRKAPHDRVAHVPFVIASHAAATASPRFTPRSPTLPAELPSVSILIPTRDKIDLLDDCVASILKLSSYPRERIEIVVVDNGSTTREALDWFDEARHRTGFRIVSAPVEFNFAYLNNLAAAASTGDILLMLNNDTVVLAPDWLERIVEQCLVPDVAAVGAKLLYADERIQHGGCNVGVAGLAAHRCSNQTHEDVADVDFTRELSAVTGACIGVRREVFERLGGLDERLKIAFNDIKFCLDAVMAGYRNIYVAEPLLYHLESKSRGLDITRAQQHANMREAIYARSLARPFFQNDPRYSPNLSQIRTDDLAFPPRRRLPWREASAQRKRRIMLVSVTHAIGSGVAVVLNEQAIRLVAAGYEVLVAGPASPRDWRYEGCRRIVVSDPLAAANIAVREKVDLVIIHTPPFYSMVRYLGAAPLVYFIDHGEPNPEFFPDAAHREDINWEKRFCMPMAARVFAISKAVRNQSLHPDVIVARNGNSHLDRWDDLMSARRSDVRAKNGWDDKLVILNVCRFGLGERYYKGIDRYVEVMKELWFRHPDTNGKVVFVLAGKGTAADAEELTRAGLAVHANPTDDEIVDLQAAADLYMNFSKWEGYNLGIGQALAMGLPVIASDIDAHREFPIRTVGEIRDALGAVHDLFAAIRDHPPRKAFVDDWDVPVGILLAAVAEDLATPAGGVAAVSLGSTHARDTLIDL